MDIRDWPGVGALEIVSQHQRLASRIAGCVYVQAAGHLRVLDEFDTVSLRTTRRRRRLISRRRYFERHT